MPTVAIVGGGVAGASAAYHLTKIGINVIVLEAGSVGMGRDEATYVPQHSVFSHDLEDESSYKAFPSGSAVFPTLPTIKMMVQLYPYTTKEFILHHGRDGAVNYLRLAREGIELQKELARKLLSHSDKQLLEKGSVYVCGAGQEEELREEYELLTGLGADVTWLDRSQVEAMHGGAPAGFTAGILFPHDAVIDSASYAKALIGEAKRTGYAEVREGCARVTQVETAADGTGALVTLSDDERLRFAHAVVATGGFYLDHNLAGILRPCWSYLVSLPTTSKSPRSTPNFFTFGFTHDWCWSEGRVRVSGEDHFSALKPPRLKSRCRSLAEWTAKKYPDWVGPVVEGDRPKYESRCGVYSETPDGLPLVGTPSPSERVCYLCGCNAWGQASLSYAAALVPGLLGLHELTEDQRELADLISIRRFTGATSRTTNLQCRL